MNSYYQYEWTFSPPDYFEEPFKISASNYELNVGSGKALATVDEMVHEANTSIRDSLQNELIGRFLGTQVACFIPYQLSKPVKTLFHADGRRSAFAEIEGLTMKASLGSVDVMITDAQGNVVTDTKRDRIAKVTSLSERIAKYRLLDRALDLTLRSHNAACREPEIELVRLYEIRDALRTRFGTESNCKKKLGLTRTEWSDFGRVCNELPLREGRHNGNATSGLRSATTDELALVRNFAQRMIEAYLKYLELSGDAKI